MPVKQTQQESPALLHNPQTAGKDEPAKLVFSDKQILAMLLQRCIPAYRTLSRDELIRRIEGNPEQILIGKPVLMRRLILSFWACGSRTESDRSNRCATYSSRAC